MVMVEKRLQYGRRARRSAFGWRLWQFSLLFLLLLAVYAVLPKVFRSYPLETLITAAVLALTGVSIVLYIGELVVVGWVVDFLSAIGMPKFIKPVPLECEQVGEITIVTLRDNITTVLQCQSVQKQLKTLIDAHHCDFVLDFFYSGSVSRSFRGVMLHVTKATRREAAKLGKPYRPVALPHGEVFRVFDDRRCAVEEMFKHDGHGWVVLCSVPVGIRAVSELT
jgi:hypothetical protein